MPETVSGQQQIVRPSASPVIALEQKGRELIERANKQRIAVMDSFDGLLLVAHPGDSLHDVVGHLLGFVHCVDLLIAQFRYDLAQPDWRERLWR